MSRTYKNIAKLGYKNEEDFVKRLNRDKKDILWSHFQFKNNEDLYFVRVTNKVPWKPAKTTSITLKKTIPKTDVFLVKVKIDRNKLILNDFYLNEKDLENYQFLVINGSGISIKLNQSNCQWDKCSLDKFYYRFESYELFAGMSLYTKDNKFKINHKIVQSCKTNWKKMANYFEEFKNHLENLDNKKILDEKDQIIFKKIQLFSKNKIYELTKKNQIILDSIFSGKNEFEEPYCANWFYYNNKLTNKYPEKFIVTNGSGRSKGKPLISFKSQTL